MEVEVLDVGKKIYEKYISDGADKLCNTLKEMKIESDYGRRAMYCYIVFKELKVLETLKNIDRLDIFDNYRPYLIMNYVKYIKKNTNNLKNITETFIRNFNYIFLNSYILNEKELRLYIKMLTDVEIPESKMENLKIMAEPLNTTEDFKKILELLTEIKNSQLRNITNVIDQFEDLSERKIKELIREEIANFDLNLKSIKDDLKKYHLQSIESINNNIELEFEKQKLENLDFNNKILDHFKSNYDILEKFNINALKPLKCSCVIFVILSTIIPLTVLCTK